MTDVRVVSPTGEVKAEPTHLKSRVIEEYGKMTEAAVEVPQGEISDADLEEDRDLLYLSEVWRSRFGETMDNGTEISVYSRGDLWNTLFGGQASTVDDYATFYGGDAADATGMVRWLPGAYGSRWEVTVNFWHLTSPPEGSFAVQYHGPVRHVRDDDAVEAQKRGGAVIFDADTNEFVLYRSDGDNETIGGQSWLDEDRTQSDPHTARVVYDENRQSPLTVHVNDTELYSGVAADYAGPMLSFAAETNGQSHFESWAFDTVRIEDDVFGGVLGSVEQKGSVAELIGDSWERRAQQAEPTASDYSPGGGTPAWIIEDLLQNVERVEPGQVTSHWDSPSVTRTFAHRSPAKVIRLVSKESFVEPMYRPNARVDYTRYTQEFFSTEQKLSRDLLAFDGELNVETDRSGEEYTHLRMLGPGSGSDQLTAKAVADGYTEGDLQRWTTISATDVDSGSDLQHIADTYIEELNRRTLVVSGVVRDYFVDLGMEYTVSAPKEDIDDEKLRAVKVERLDGNDGVRYRSTFANRAKTWYSTGQRVREDVENHNRG